MRMSGPTVDSRSVADTGRKGRIPLGITTVDGRRIAMWDVESSLSEEAGLLQAAAMATTPAMITVVTRSEAVEAVRQLQDRLLTAEHEAHQRLVRDLHDGVQQLLLSLRFELKRGLRQDSLQSTQRILGKCDGIVLEVVEEIRRLARGIQSPTRREMGLAVAVEKMAEAASCVVHLSIPDERFDAQVESALYFFFAETLTNAQKHAGCANVYASLWLDERGHAIVGEVCDDGRGGARIMGGGGLAGSRTGSRVDVANCVCPALRGRVPASLPGSHWKVETEMRVAIADDSGLFRDSLALSLAEIGIDVCSRSATTAGLLSVVAREPLDVAIIDVFFKGRNDGIGAAQTIRREYPRVGVLLLSAQTVTRQAIDLLREFDGGIGYLSKDNVADVEELRVALERVAAGESVVDGDVVRRLLHAPVHEEGLRHLTDQERRILNLMAEGYSNRGIAQAVFLSERRVEDHVGHIFTKLGIDANLVDRNRRVLAVLQWLRLSNA